MTEATAIERLGLFHLSHRDPGSWSEQEKWQSRGLELEVIFEAEGADVSHAYGLSDLVGPVSGLAWTYLLSARETDSGVTGSAPSAGDLEFVERKARRLLRDGQIILGIPFLARYSDQVARNERILDWLIERSRPKAVEVQNIEASASVELYTAEERSPDACTAFDADVQGLAADPNPSFYRELLLERSDLHRPHYGLPVEGFRDTSIDTEWEEWERELDEAFKALT